MNGLPENSNNYASRWEREVEQRIAKAEADLLVTKRDYELTAKHIQTCLGQIMEEMKGVRNSLNDGGQKFTELSGKIVHLTECTMTCDDFNGKMEAFMKGRTDCQVAVAKELRVTNDRIDTLTTKVENHASYFKIIGIATGIIATGLFGLFGKALEWWGG